MALESNNSKMEPIPTGVNILLLKRFLDSTTGFDPGFDTCFDSDSDSARLRRSFSDDSKYSSGWVGGSD